MRNRHWGDARHRAIGAAVAVLGVLALLQYWLVDRRPAAPQRKAAQEFVVTSSADDGAGSLREAIFAADSAAGRARITLRAETVVLRSSLPPLVNPAGIVIEGAERSTEIDARALAAGPIFDVAAPNSMIRAVIVTNAPEQAILVRADGFRLIDATVRNSDEGLSATDGIRNLVIEKTRFENNRIGVRLASSAPGIIVRSNVFNGHRDAALWAVRADPSSDGESRGFTLDANVFENDRMALVLGNTPATIERNEFVKSREVALFLIGHGAIVRGNRIRGGGGIGIFADATRGSLIEANEIDHNVALAVLVRSSGGALLNKNRIYDNGYGVAFVLNERGAPNVASDNVLLQQQYDGIIVIGDSPVLRRNLARNNGSAGLRILTFQPLTGPAVASRPFLDGNTLDGNTPNDVARGVYRVTVAESTP